MVYIISALPSFKGEGEGILKRGANVPLKHPRYKISA